MAHDDAGAGGRLRFTFVVIIFFVIFSVLMVGSFMYQRSVDSRELAAIENARQAQVEACDRVNTLRIEVNRAIDAMHRNIELSAEVWQELADENEDNGVVYLEAAARHRELLGLVNPVNVPDCQEIVPNYQEIMEQIEEDSRVAAYLE